MPFRKGLGLGLIHGYFGGAEKRYTHWWLKRSFFFVVAPKFIFNGGRWWLKRPHTGLVAQINEIGGSEIFQRHLTHDGVSLCPGGIGCAGVEPQCRFGVSFGSGGGSGGGLPTDPARCGAHRV